MKQKNKQVDFSGTLAAGILGNVLVGREVIRAGEDTIKAGENF